MSVEPTPAELIERGAAAIWAITENLKSLATSDISCGEKIDGCTIAWIAEKLEEEADKISAAAERVMKSARPRAS